MSVTRQELLSLALGQLSAGDQQRVQRELDQSPELRAALRQDLDALSFLLSDLDTAHFELPPEAEESLLMRIRLEPPQQTLGLPTAPLPPAPVTVPEPAPRSWVWPAVIAGATALLLSLALRPSSDLPTRYASTPGAVVKVAQSTEGSDVARLVRLKDGRVYVHMERPLEAGQVYQVWRLLPRGHNRVRPRSLGVFEGGMMTTPMPRTAVLAVSVEPPGGSERPTSPLLFKQRLR